MVTAKIIEVGTWRNADQNAGKVGEENTSIAQRRSIKLTVVVCSQMIIKSLKELVL